MKRYEILGQRVLIRPDEVVEKTDSGILLPGHWDKEKERAAMHTGEVIAIGPLAWKDFQDGTPWCKVGDRVVFARHAGKILEDLNNPKEVLFAIRDEDVQCVIRED